MFRTLCNPDIFRTLLYSPLWYILKIKHIETPTKYLRWSILLRTLWLVWVKGSLGQNLKMEKPAFPNLLILEHLKSHFINPSLLNTFLMCFEINWLKYLNWPFWGFYPGPPFTHTTLIAIKTFFIVKTAFITHKFTWIHMNSHNYYTYIQKYIFWGSNYFGVYGCWLVWLLLYVFMFSDWLVWLLICLTILFSKTEPGKKYFFYQSFHHK